MSVLSRILRLGPGTHYQEGLRLFDAGRYDASAAALEIAAQEKRDALTQRLALFYLAECYARLGTAAGFAQEWARARDFLSRALALNPHYADLHLSLGRACRKMGDRTGAAAAFAHALDINPRYARAAFYEGLALYEQGRHAEGLVLMDEAAQADSLLDNGPYRAALAAHEAGQCGPALLLLERAAEDDEVARLSFKAQEFARAGRSAEAEAQWRAALRIAPRYPDLHHGLGVALAAQGHLAEAIRAFEAALDINPKYGEARAHLSEALQAAGRPDQAQAVLKCG